MSESEKPGAPPPEFEREFQLAGEEAARQRSRLRRAALILLVPLVLALWVYVDGLRKQAEVERLARVVATPEASRALESLASPETQQAIARLDESGPLLTRLDSWVASAPPVENLDRVAELAGEVETLKEWARIPPATVVRSDAPGSALLARSAELLALADAVPAEDVRRLSRVPAELDQLRHTIGQIESQVERQGEREPQEQAALLRRVQALEQRSSSGAAEERAAALEARVRQLEEQLKELRRWQHSPPKL